MAADLTADPVTYIDREVTMFGVISQESYYNYGYDDCESTHNSFRFVPMEAGLKPQGGQNFYTFHLYMPREKAKSLVDTLAKLRKAQKGEVSAVVRVKITRLPERHGSDGGDTWELLDWQRPTEDHLGWGKWQVGSKTTRKRR